MARIEIAERDTSGAKQMRIDLIKVTLVSLKDRGKRFAVVSRCAARHAWADRFQACIISANPKRYFAAVQNRIVRAADSREVVTCHRRQWRGSKSTFNA